MMTGKLAFLIERAVRKKKATIKSVCGEGTWDDDPSNVLIRRILWALGEHERKVICARTKNALLHKQRNGIRVTHPDRSVEKIACLAEKSAPQ